MFAGFAFVGLQSPVGFRHSLLGAVDPDLLAYMASLGVKRGRAAYGAANGSNGAAAVSKKPKGVQLGFLSMSYFLSTPLEPLFSARSWCVLLRSVACVHCYWSVG